MNLLDKITKSAKSSVYLKASSPELARLDRVRSVRECIKIFESKGWIEREGLPAGVISSLIDICADMRSRGMGMEPNFIGRAVARCLASPRRIGDVSLRFGAQDSDFAMHAAEADEKRDGGDHGGAEFAYYRVLALYPGHSTILVQYSHMLKEQHKYVDALVFYLDAALYGAPLVDVEEHALFVANIIGAKAEAAARLSDPAATLSSSTLRMIHHLLFGREAPIALVLELMLGRAGLPEVFAELMRKNDFGGANRDLLRVVAETGWRPQHA